MESPTSTAVAVPALCFDACKEVLASRSAFYMTLAGLYFAPLDQAQIDSMTEGDLFAYAGEEGLLGEGFNDMARYLRKRNSGTKQLLAIDYTASFGGAELWKGRSAMPVSSLFLSDSGLLYHGSRDQVYAAYRRQALDLRKDAHLPEDHLAFEFEFISILSQRAAAALEAGDAAQAIENLRLSREFIESHIIPWFRELAKLAALLVKTRFYKGVMKITEGYMLFDLGMIDDLIEEISGACPPVAQSAAVGTQAAAADGVRSAAANGVKATTTGGQAEAVGTQPAASVPEGGTAIRTTSTCMMGSDGK
ncbi:MAG: molecular chaperone TorD family protein [Coriobacteriaceae bacterium]|jgi:TorA maturation chaperone TorD|nr:molecular chaperone TorD family protein [Coriobacteriaceae bacterium]